MQLYSAVILYILDILIYAATSTFSCDNYVGLFWLIAVCSLPQERVTGMDGSVDGIGVKWQYGHWSMAVM